MAEICRPADPVDLSNLSIELSLLLAAFRRMRTSGLSHRRPISLIVSAMFELDRATIAIVVSGNGTKSAIVARPVKETADDDDV